MTRPPCLENKREAGDWWGIFNRDGFRKARPCEGNQPVEIHAFEDARIASRPWKIRLTLHQKTDFKNKHKHKRNRGTGREGDRFRRAKRVGLLADAGTQRSIR